MASNKIKKGDTGTKLYFSIKRSNSQPLDLTNAAIKMIMAGRDAARRIEKSCSIANAEKGECFCVLTANDTSTVGKYEIEVVIERNGSKLTTTNQGTLDIMEVL